MDCAPFRNIGEPSATLSAHCASGRACHKNGWQKRPTSRLCTSAGLNVGRRISLWTRQCESPKRWESGSKSFSRARDSARAEKKITLETLQRIAKVLKLRITDLIAGL